jgi:hypothetical protein
MLVLASSHPDITRTGEATVPRLTPAVEVQNVFVRGKER